MTVIGSTKITLTNNSASGTANGELVRNGALLEYHNGTSSEVIATNSATATLTNKTLTAPVLDSYVDLDRITIPSSPSANKGRVYVKQLDANNDAVYIIIKKSGSYQEVQIA
jgi:hypothetical protein